MTFPASLRTLSQGSFYQCGNLRTAKFNEGLEVLGSDERSRDGRLRCGVFEGSALRRVELPSTLKKMTCNTFDGC